MKQEQELNRIEKLLAIWLAEIRLRNARNKNDINRISQDLALKLLNEIYDYELENLDRETPNHPSVDLGDKKNQIAFQITSRIDGTKVKEDLDKFVKRGFDKIYKNGIRFLILNLEKVIHIRIGFKKIYPKFDKDKHILTEKNLIREIERIYNENPGKFERIKGILETEIGYLTNNEISSPSQSAPTQIISQNILLKDNLESREKQISSLLDQTTKQICQKIFDNGRFPSLHLMQKYRDELIDHLENPPAQLSLDAQMERLITVVKAFLMSDEKEDAAKARKYYDRAFGVYKNLKDNSRWHEKLLRILALLLSSEGKAEEAINSLNPSEDPKSVSLRLSLLISADKFGEALNWLSVNEVKVEWTGEAIYIYVHAGMLEKAERLFEDTLEDFNRIKTRKELEGSPYQNDVFYEKLNFQMVLALYSEAIKIINKPPMDPIYPTDLTPDAQKLLKKALGYIDGFFQQASRQNPESNYRTEQMLRFEIGILTLLGNFEQVDRVIQNLLSLEPIDKKVVELMLTRFEHHEKNTFEDISRRLEKDYPDDWRTWLNIAQIKIKLNDKKKAWDAVVKADECIKTEDEKMDFIFAVMEISYLIDRLEDAYQIFKNYFPLYKNKTNLIEGLYYWFQGSRKDAVRILANVKDKDLKNTQKAQIKAFMGEYASEKKRWKQSKKFYLESLKLGKNPFVMRKLMYVLGKLQEDEEVLEDVLKIAEEIESLGFGDEYITYIKAQATRNLGKFEESEKGFRNLLDINPKNPEYAINLAHVLQYRDRNEEALNVVKKFIQPDDNFNPRCLALAKDIYQLEGEAGKAFQILEKCFPKIQNDPDLLLSYVKLGFKVGEEKRAQETFLTIQRLKEEGKIPDDVLKVYPIDEAVKVFIQQKKDHEELLKMYTHGKISRVHICKNTPLFLEWAYRTQELLEKYLNMEDRSKVTIYSTNSFHIYVDKDGRATIARIEAPEEVEEIAVEINALITIHQLGLLEKLSVRYKKIFYPGVYHRIFKMERSQYSPHQAKRESIYQSLYDKIKDNEIIEISLDLHGEKIQPPKISLFLAQNEKIPLVDNFIEKEELKNFTDVVVLRICDIADFLYEKGCLGEDKRKEIRKISEYKPSFADCDWKEIVLDKMRLVVPVLTLESMEEFDLIQKLLQMGIEINIEKSNADEIRSKVNTFHFREKVGKCHEDLFKKIKENPNFQSFSIPLTKKECDMIEDIHNEAMLNVIKFAHQNKLALLSDDRWFQMTYNNFLVKHAFGTDKLLEDLYEKGIITIEEYANAFLRLCKWRYRFLLPDSRILVFFAKQYKNSLPGEELKSIANYFRNTMEVPGLFVKVESTNPPLSVGVTYYLLVIEIWLKFLCTIWEDESFGIDNINKITDWFYCCGFPEIPGEIPENKRVLLYPHIEEALAFQLILNITISPDHIRLNQLLEKSLDYISWKPGNKVTILKKYIELLTQKRTFEIGIRNQIPDESISVEMLRTFTIMRVCEAFYGKKISDIQLPLELFTVLNQIDPGITFYLEKIKTEEVKRMKKVLDEEVESLKNIPNYKKQRLFVVKYSNREVVINVFHNLLIHPAVEIRNNILELITLSNDISSFSKEEILSKKEMITSDDVNIAGIEAWKAEKIILRDFHYVKSLLGEPLTYFNSKVLNEIWENIFVPDLNTVISRLPLLIQGELKPDVIINRIIGTIDQFDDINSILDWYLKELFFMPLASPLNVWKIIQGFRLKNEKNNETTLSDEDIFYSTIKWIENKKDPLAFIMAFEIFLHLASNPGNGELIKSMETYRDDLLELLLLTESAPIKIEKNLFENVHLRWDIRCKFSQYYLKYIELNLPPNDKFHDDKKVMMAWWMASEVERALLSDSKAISMESENSWLKENVFPIIEGKNWDIYFEYQFHHQRKVCSLSLYYTLFSFPSLIKITLGMIFLQGLSGEHRFSFKLNNTNVRDSILKALSKVIVMGEGQLIPSQKSIPLFLWELPLNLSVPFLLKELNKINPNLLGKEDKIFIGFAEHLVHPNYLKNELKNFQTRLNEKDFINMTFILGSLRTYITLNGNMPKEAEILKDTINSIFNIISDSPWGPGCLLLLCETLKQLILSGIRDYSKILLKGFKEFDFMNSQLKEEEITTLIWELISISYLGHDLSVLEPVFKRKLTDKLVKKTLKEVKKLLENIIIKFPHEEREYIRKILNELEDIV